MMGTMGKIALLVLLAAGCGPRQPGAAPNQTYFWRVMSSEVTFGACSDEPQFRKDLMPLKFESNSFLIYKVAPDGKTAVNQTCDRVDPDTCKPSATNVTFTVANPELIFVSEGKSAFGMTGCQLLDNTTWTLTDLGATGTLEITHVLSLVDNPAACMATETQFKQQSPNMLGLEGCVVTFKIGLTLN
jgi:hypothetical protein